MIKKDKQIDNPNYCYLGINTNKKKKEILNILSCMKEIRDTAYPLKNSDITELKIDSFIARKEKDIILINGILLLIDGEKQEKRSFETYVMNMDTKQVRVYMDITRENVDDEPKMIRTTEEINLEKKITVVTKYNQIEGIEEKTFTVKISQEAYVDFLKRQNTEQLSAL